MLVTKYAIVIVTYNREQLLRECVDHASNQTIRPYNIIVVDNASTDGSKEYLAHLKEQNELYDIIELQQNVGGAGGFKKGIERALEKDVECILMIDDDAILDRNYMERILQERAQQSKYHAFVGVVKTEGKISKFHRRNLIRPGLLSKECDEQEYGKNCFTCDIASFCGMVVDTSLIRRIGLPHAEYFIWHDDTEYSMRILRYSKFMVITDAELNHKTKSDFQKRPRRYDWKEYYAVRNRILMVREHGSFMDRIVNFISIFIHVIFRNWFFGIIKRDKYDWKYERRLVKAAIKNSKGEKLQNIKMKHEK